MQFMQNIEQADAKTIQPTTHNVFFTNFTLITVEKPTFMDSKCSRDFQKTYFRNDKALSSLDFVNFEYYTGSPIFPYAKYTNVFPRSSAMLLSARKGGMCKKPYRTNSR